MERLFKVLSHKGRLSVVEHLLANGPTKQKGLVSALIQSGRAHPNDGTMSTWITELAIAGLVEPGDSKQDPVSVAHTEQVGRLLGVASALTLAVATEAHEAAEVRHAELRRGITKAQDDQAADG
jgi:hypothetical protein